MTVPLASSPVVRMRELGGLPPSVMFSESMLRTSRAERDAETEARVACACPGARPAARARQGIYTVKLVSCSFLCT
jgi:hypothetical protein